jgi:hypothetical protein
MQPMAWDARVPAPSKRALGIRIEGAVGGLLEGVGHEPKLFEVQHGLSCEGSYGSRRLVWRLDPLPEPSVAAALG